MNAKIITLLVFVAGVIVARAQSNPSSTNGTDLEMEMPWPNGDVYVSSYNAVDYEMGTIGPDYIYYDKYDWSEDGGGSGYSSIVYPDAPFASQTNAYIWPGTSWPEQALGESISLPGPTGTNYDAPPPYNGSGNGTLIDYVYFGSANLTEFLDGGEEIAQHNDQEQITLVTGGVPGTTGSELFGVNASAQNDLPNNNNIPPQQINVSGFGALGSNGYAFAVLPLHSQVVITPNASGGQYYEFYEGIQPFQLVSQCVSPIPSNQSRTTIGVGEQVNLGFSPTLPTNAVWSTTAGSLSYLTNTSTQFTAPSSPGSATVTANVQGKRVSISFNVVAPSGIDHAVIVDDYSNSANWYNVSYSLGYAGAGMDLDVYVAPTNVSFYRVCIMEVPGPASDITGYFITNSVSPHGTEQGAGEWSPPLSYANQFQDTAASIFPGIPPPWTAGGFDWVIQSDWQVQGSSVTNNFTQWTESFRLLDANGDFSTSKFGQTVTRTTSDLVTQ